MNDKLSLPSPSRIKQVLTLDRGRLPSFPQVVLKLLEIDGDETGSLDEVARVVASDPAVAAGVLEVVNSAMYGLQRKIGALPEAIVLLGLHEIKKLTMGLSVFHDLFAGEGTRAFDRIHFWRHSLFTALLAMEIARRVGYPRPEEAYVGGLLHDVGKIFLDLQGRRDYEEVAQDAADPQENLVLKERQLLGLGHDDIGAYFCSHWQLPDRIVLGVKYHHQRFHEHALSREEALLASIVSMADFVSWTQGVGSFTAGSPPVLTPEAQGFIDVEKTDIMGSIRAVNREMESISEFYNFIFPTPNEIHENLLKMNLRLGRANTRYFYMETPATVQGLAEAPAITFSPDAGAELFKSLARARTVKEVLDSVMFQVGAMFEPVHWSLLLKDPKSEDMVFTMVAGVNRERLQGTRLPRGEGLAGYVMETGKPVVVEDLSTDRGLKHRLPPVNGFEPRTCMAIQIRNQNKLLGAMELVNRVNGKGFTSGDLHTLTSLSEHIAAAIERAYFHQALQKMATVDSLTGLKNRYNLERVLSNPQEIMGRYGPDTSLMIVDIDQFKRYNQANGRQAGDGLLKHLAAVLKMTFRRTDDIFRYEGDKFIVLLSGTDRLAAEAARERILQTFAPPNGQPDVSISIFVHTLKVDDAQGWIHWLQERLIRDKAVFRNESLQSMEDNLQPLLEEEMRQAASAVESNYTKEVSLLGDFVSLRNRSHGRITVEGLSLNKMGIVITSGQPVRAGDFLDISFHLDDARRSWINRRVLVKKVDRNRIDVEVHNPPIYAKALGFYLMG
jgi:diguanylate cyclase (GGDEF)-like protein/putative nucleotidyltransferase with HDIG domain